MNDEFNKKMRAVISEGISTGEISLLDLIHGLNSTVSCILMETDASLEYVKAMSDKFVRVHTALMKDKNKRK